jgi:hypothetical protein
MKRIPSSGETVKPFFLDGEGSEEYKSVRDGINPLCVSVRDFIESVWPQCKQYLDSEVRRDACEHFHQRWWEVYLAYSLLGASVQMVGRALRPRKDGPDLLAQVAGKNIWIEAVAPRAGDAADAVRSSGPSKGPKPFPDKEIMLRFQQAFSTKVDVHGKYVQKGWVSPHEAYVVALNGALAEGGYPCTQRFPRIVSALLCGLESEGVVLKFDETGQSQQEVFYEYALTVQKKSKKSVDLAVLRDSANSCVSAVLYSASDAFNCSFARGVKSDTCDVMTRDFVLVLNPLAQVPLPPDFLSAVPRYWIEPGTSGFTLHSLYADSLSP